MKTICKFRKMDEEQYNGGMGKITFDSYIFDGEDYTLYDYLIDNNNDGNDIRFDDNTGIMVTNNGEFVEYYDCITYEKKEN